MKIFGVRNDEVRRVVAFFVRQTRKIGAADFFKQMCYHNRVSNGVLVFCVNAREGEIREKC